MIELHKAYGKISLFVDHFKLDNFVDMRTTSIEVNNKKAESNIKSEKNGSSDNEDTPEYDAETNNDESDTGSLYIDSDCNEDLKNIKIKKKFMKAMNNSIELPVFIIDQLGFNSYVLRSEWGWKI